MSCNIRRCAAANNKYMKEYKKEKDSNNLFGWALSQKLPVESFKWKKNAKTQ